MWKLIKLEYVKNNIWKYVMKSGIILTIFLGFFFAFTFLGIAVDSDTGTVEPDMIGRLVMLVTACVDLVYIIYSTSMYSAFIIDPYENKSMNLLFTYPVSRKKIVFSKIGAVWMFTLASLILTRAVVFMVLKLCGNFLTPDFWLNYSLTDGSFWLQQIIASVETVTISLLAVWGGLMRKSKSASIVFSVLLIVIMQGAVGDVSFRSQRWLPVLLMVLGIISIAGYFMDVEKKDVPDF